MLISILICALVGPAEKVTHMLASFYLYCQHFSLSAVQILLTWLMNVQRNRSGAISQLYAPTSCSLPSKSAADLLLLVSSLIYTGTLVTVPVSVFTLAARMPRARTED